jgi:hypothetical protein
MLFTQDNEKRRVLHRVIESVTLLSQVTVVSKRDEKKKNSRLATFDIRRYHCIINFW